MKRTAVKLKDIPEAILPFINVHGKDNTQAHYNGHVIESVFIFRDKYRVYCKGEYRLDGDTEIDVY